MDKVIIVFLVPTHLSRLNTMIGVASHRNNNLGMRVDFSQNWPAYTGQLCVRVCALSRYQHHAT